MSDNLSNALALAERDWYVFPLGVLSKNPLIKKKDGGDGWHDATTESATVRQWWAKTPRANIGIATKPSGVILFDLDVKNGENGLAAWAALMREHGFTDDGAMHQRTPSGGEHRIFALPEGVNPESIADNRPFPGIDVKTTGYFLAEPSRVTGDHPGEYAFDVSTHPLDGYRPAPLPDALLALLLAANGDGKRKPAEPLPDRLVEGQRNTQLTSLAGSMRQRNASEDAILAALEVMNAERCDPPLPQREVEAIAKSVARYPPGGRDTGLSESITGVEMKRILPINEIDAALTLGGEEGPADLFARLFHNEVMFDHCEKAWFLWDGQHWRKDRTRDIMAKINIVAAQFLRLAASARAEGDDDRSKAALSVAGRLRYKNVMKNVLELAGSKTPVKLAGDEWDSDPMLLGVANGVLDLKTGELRPGKPSEYIRTVAPTEWQGLDAQSGRWKQFLDEIFDKDPELVAFVQRLLGYGLAGLSVEHHLPVLWGAGRNGKDTLLETLRHVLGPLASPVGGEVLLSAGRAPNQASPHVYAMRHLRLCWASETNEGARLAAGQVKMLTGGGSISCRPLYGEPVVFEPKFLLMLVTNFKPHVSADDYAAWKRLLLIPFNVAFVDWPQAENERQRDPRLAGKLKAESPGVLAWLVRGCLEWQRIGLNPPEVVRAATEEYRSEEDTLGIFFSECCTIAPDLETKSGELYRHYKDWAEDHGVKPMSLTAFGKRCKRRFDWRKTTHVVYDGVGIGQQTSQVAAEQQQDKAGSSFWETYTIAEKEEARRWS